MKPSDRIVSMTIAAPPALAPWCVIVNTSSAMKMSWR
jgi:hypothetical protein